MQPVARSDGDLTGTSLRSEATLYEITAFIEKLPALGNYYKNDVMACVGSEMVSNPVSLGSAPYHCIFSQEARMAEERWVTLFVNSNRVRAHLKLSETLLFRKGTF